MIQLNEILNLLNVSQDGIVEGAEIKHAQAITDETFGLNSIGWCSDKNIGLLNDLSGGFVIVSNTSYRSLGKLESNICLIPVDNPRHAFLKVLQAFFVDQPTWGDINSTAQIDLSVDIDRKLVTIAANVVIERGCTIGKNVVIGANTVIKTDTIIEDGCKIG